MGMSLDEIKKMQEKFDRQHSGAIEFYEEIGENNLYVLEHLIVCLVGELGEFSNLLKKVYRGDIQLGSAKSDLDEEVIDIFIYLIKIANQFNVDLEKGFIQKMEKNQKRFLQYKK